MLMLLQLFMYSLDETYHKYFINVVIFFIFATKLTMTVLQFGSDTETQEIEEKKKKNNIIIL